MTYCNLSLEKNNLLTHMHSLSFIKETLENKFMFINNGEQPPSLIMIKGIEKTISQNFPFYLTYFCFFENQNMSHSYVKVEWFYLSVLLFKTNNGDFCSLEKFCIENNLGVPDEHTGYFLKALL